MHLFRFPNFWFGDKLPIAPSFHLTARDAVLGEKDSSETASNHINAARLYLSQIMLNCCDPDVTLTTVKDFLGPGSGVTPELLVGRLSDNSAVREEQLQCGVLLRLDRVQSILKSIQDILVDPSSAVDVVALRAAARCCTTKKLTVTTASSNSVADCSSSSGGLNGVTLSKNGEISEMDRLRIISQVAFNFL